MGHGLVRAWRITSSREIRELFRGGKREETRHLDVFMAPSPASFPRLGVVVPRHRQSAVARNRLKRRLREIGRTEALPALRQRGRRLDLLIRARPSAYGAAFDELAGGLARLIEKVCSHGDC
ncbi:MAG: ribonuclease P protein component [Longimicrobiaceae bacterium]